MAGLSFKVPLIAQRTKFGCWIASYRMIESWYNSLIPGRPPITDRKLIGPGGVEPPLKSERVLDFARMVGMTAVYAPGTLDGVRKLLQTYGPLWYAANAFNHNAPTTGHVVVLTGIENDMVVFNDPFPPGVGAESQMFDAVTFFGEYLTPIDNPSPFLVMLKGSRPTV